MDKAAKRSRGYRLRKRILKNAQVNSEDEWTLDSTSSSAHSEQYSEIEDLSDFAVPATNNELHERTPHGINEQDVCYAFNPSHTFSPSPTNSEPGDRHEKSSEDGSSDGESDEMDDTGEQTSISSSSSNASDDTDVDGRQENEINVNCVNHINENPQRAQDEISKLQEWAVLYRIPATHLDALLKILRERLLPELPASSKTFLHTESAEYTIKKMKDVDGLDGEFAYLGIKKGLEACLNPDLHENGEILVDINVDGVKVKKSSKKILWPVLIRVFYSKMPHSYKPFTACVFYGKGKPADVRQFLHEFIQEMNHLSSAGVVINSKTYKILIRTIIADTPARDFLKATKGHTSYNGCGRCDTEAIKIDKNIVYQSVGNTRTDDDFRNFTDINHHNDVSPLIALIPMIDMIKMFVLDSMHLLYLGFMLRIFNCWRDGEPAVKLSVTQRNELDRRTKMLKKDIPYEFKRKMRSTNEFADYKASEHRFFVLYVSPIVLKKILTDECYNHFLLFHVSCRMLSSKKAVDYVRLVKNYLSQFVEKSKELYGSKFVSLNIHCGHHIADDVEFTKSNVNDISAFPFESELRLLKEILRSPHNTLAQYCRRVHEERMFLDKTAKVEEELQILKITKTREILKLMFRQQHFSNQHPDNTALLNDGSVVKIIQLSLVNSVVCAKVMDFSIVKLVYENPCQSSLLRIYEIEERPAWTHVRDITLNSISTKLIRISINFAPDDPIRTFVLPILH